MTIGGEYKRKTPHTHTTPVLLYLYLSIAPSRPVTRLFHSTAELKKQIKKNTRTRIEETDEGYSYYTAL